VAFLVPQKKFNRGNTQNKTNKNKKYPNTAFVVFFIEGSICSVCPKNDDRKNDGKKNSEN
jgi:hypothetical protein